MSLSRIHIKSLLIQCAFALLFSLNGNVVLADEQLQFEQKSNIETFVVSLDTNIEYEPNFSLSPEIDTINSVQPYAIVTKPIEQQFIDLARNKSTIRAPPYILINLSNPIANLLIVPAI